MRNEFENGASSGADSPMLIDQYLPEYDATEGRHVIANADPETTYEAMLTADLMNTGPIVRALGRLRDVPRVASHWLGGTRGPPHPSGCGSSTSRRPRSGRLYGSVLVWIEGEP